MSKKIDFHLKILYQLLLNARIKNKEISKLVYKSPQLVSYWVEKLEKENIIQAYKIQIDPAKFGLIDIQVFMIFTTSDKKRQNEIITYLKDSDHVTFIENITHGADLLIEYTVPNLSFFNKLHSRFLDLFSGSIKVIDLFPVIVKHYLSKKYINKNAKPENSSIVSGDRKPVSLSGNEKKVLSVLFKDPKASIINIAQKTKLDTRTVLKIKKSLEKEKIIRKYTITLNYEKQIGRAHV